MMGMGAFIWLRNMSQLGVFFSGSSFGPCSLRSRAASACAGSV